eukprot:1161425-Pelagomonas_calceolata.AAC.12
METRERQPASLAGCPIRGAGDTRHACKVHHPSCCCCCCVLCLLAFDDKPGSARHATAAESVSAGAGALLNGGRQHIDTTQHRKTTQADGT